ncbi:MAG: hydroxyacylglutathione hydrolase, partial [Myxococcota bacterium]|nr:hydroxyacylglutathione hydrolase [Myxococcota bacterium]
PPFYSRCKNLKIHQIPAASDNLIWLIEYEPGFVAAVDGPSAKEVLIYCRQHALELTTIINTHTHGDHIGINRDLQRKGMLSKIRVVGSKSRRDQIPGITEGVEDGDQVQLGSACGTVFLTEGHIDGHVSYLFSDVLFCGDTLFTGGCGYLFDGPPSKMYHSLQRLASLPDHTKVCCAHEYTIDNLRFAISVEPQNTMLQERYHQTVSICQNGGSVVPSTMLDERQTNPFIRTESAELQENLQRFYPDLQTDDPVAVFTRCREHKNRKLYRR